MLFSKASDETVRGFRFTETQMDKKKEHQPAFTLQNLRFWNAKQ